MDQRLHQRQASERACASADAPLANPSSTCCFRAAMDSRTLPTSGSEDASDDDEASAMQAMGLPVRFASRKRFTSRKDPSPKIRSISGSPEDQLTKYYSQKYRLFHRFDEGIRMDRESWYSVTPEAIAAHIAKRCSVVRPLLLVDVCCGAGGNSIQFALLCPTARVLAIDISPAKVALARHNARVYGVEERIDFLVGDCMHIMTSCRIPADVAFLSPEWGGPKYLGHAQLSLEDMRPNGRSLLQVVQRHLTQNIAFLLPRNAILSELQSLTGASARVEIESNIIHKKIKTLTAYFGDLIRGSESSPQ